MSLSDTHRQLAEKLVKRGLGVPAVFVLEGLKPFSVVAQQTMIACSPLAVFGGFQGLHSELTGLFDDRENLEAMLLEVERLMEADHE